MTQSLRERLVGLLEFWDKKDLIVAVDIILFVVREKVESMKRTDDTQMNDDHMYDEALDDLLKQLE